MNNKQIVTLIIGGVILLGLFIGYLSEMNRLNSNYKIDIENTIPIGQHYYKEDYNNKVDETNRNYQIIGLFVVGFMGVSLFLAGNKNKSPNADERATPKNEKTSGKAEISELKNKIERLSDLRDEGILTAEEFEAKKEKIINEYSHKI